MPRTWILACLLGCAAPAVEKAALYHTEEVIQAEPPISYYVPVYLPGEFEEGNLLFSDSLGWRQQRVIEVDRKGRVVWKYDVPEAWTLMTGVMDVTRLPTGNTLFAIDAIGVFEVNPEGELVWSHRMDHASHDVDRLDNGNTLVVDGWAAYGAPQIREITPEGEIAWTYDAEALDYPPLSDVEEEGWLHPPGAERFDDGSMLVAVRNLDRVIQVAKDGTLDWEVIFGDGGGTYTEINPLSGGHPHDSERVDEDTLLAPIHSPDLIVEVDIPSKTSVWEWSPGDEIEGARGPRDANRLANGNTLITLRNHIVEVNAAGEIVWLMHSRLVSTPEGDPTEGLSLTEDLTVENYPASFYKGVLITPSGEVFGD
jgi:hypothetical protein